MELIKKITAIATVVIGIVVIILGITAMAPAPDHNLYSGTFQYSATDYDVDYASFGGDFYTYVYGASDTIVDELSDINEAFETVVKAENAINEAVNANVKVTDDLIDAVNKIGGLIIVSIGLLIFANGLNKAGNAFAPMFAKKGQTSGF